MFAYVKAPTSLLFGGSTLVSFSYLGRDAQVGEMLGEQPGSMFGWGDRTSFYGPKTPMPVDSDRESP